MSKAMEPIENALSRFQGKKIVFVSGNFNIIHPGHLRLLKFAAELADHLVVGVNNDHAEGVQVPSALRLEGIQAVSLVDYSFILTTSVEETIKFIKPSIVVKGNEYKDSYNTESAAVESYGGTLVFSSGEIKFSSMDLLKKDIYETKGVFIEHSSEYLSRHPVTKEDGVEVFDRIRNLRVLVIGDTIVDEYITCEALGMSREDPTIVVSPIATTRFIGGAGIVAAHARSLGADVKMFSVLGSDDTAQYALEKLKEYDVKLDFVVDEKRPTTLKQRYRSQSKTLLRVSHLRQTDISEKLTNELVKKIESQLDDTDLIIFSDFNYGCLTQSLIDKLNVICQDKNVKMVADSQSSSQIGDVSRYLNTEFLTPTEHEARLALSDFSSGLVVLAEKLRKKAAAKNILLTLGAEGILVHSADINQSGRRDDRIPALNLAPKDTSGAGDSFLTCASLVYCSGESIWRSAYFGAMAAAVQVSRIGNIPITPENILRQMK